MPEVVEEAVTQVEAEVIAAREVAQELVGTSSGGPEAKIEAPVRVLEVVEIDNADKSYFFFLF